MAPENNPKIICHGVNSLGAVRAVFVSRVALDQTLLGTCQNGRSVVGMLTGLLYTLQRRHFPCSRGSLSSPMDSSLEWPTLLLFSGGSRGSTAGSGADDVCAAKSGGGGRLMAEGRRGGSRPGALVTIGGSDDIDADVLDCGTSRDCMVPMDADCCGLGSVKDEYVEA